MIKKFGVFVNKIKMPLLVTLLLAVSCFMYANIFRSNKTAQIANAVSTEQLAGKINEDNALVISLNDQNQKSSKIASMAFNSNNIKDEEGRTWSWTGSSQVDGGTTFGFALTDNKPVITLKDRNSNTLPNLYTNKAIFGYKIIGYVIGSEANGNNKYLRGAYYDGGWVYLKNNGSGLAVTTDASDIEFTTETLIPNYNENSKIYIYTYEVPVSYTLKLWYDNDHCETVNTNIDADPKTNLTNNNVPDNGKIFGHWSFTYPNNVTSNNSNKTVTLNLENNAYLVFDYANKLTVNGTTYYNVTAVKGYAIDTFNNTFNTAVVKAVWSNPYDLTFDNSGAQQNGKTNGNGDALAGVYAKKNSSATETGGTSATVTIQDGVSSYALFNSDGKAFYTKNDFSNSSNRANQSGSGANGGYYYLYNYGYEITNYSLSLREKNGGTTNWYSLHLNGSDWALNNVNNSSSVDVSTNLDSLASYLDTYFQESTSELSIFATPTWQAVDITINVKNQDISTNTTYCAPSYEIQTNTISSSGQSLAGFYTEGNNGNSNLNDASTILGYGNKNIILSSGTFDYVNLIASQYSYSGGVYTLSVLPLFMDNVYKVNLIDSFQYPEQNSSSLLNSGSDYVFSPATNGMLAKVTYTKVMTANTTSATEAYAKGTFKGCLEQYAKQIDLSKTLTSGEDHSVRDLLRKVYYSNATLSGTTLNLSNNTSVFIYLVHGKTTGSLPVFSRPNYELIYWYNTASNKMFKTYMFDNSADYGELTYDVATTWHYVDDDGDNQYLAAYFFQKYYFLNVQTLVDYNSFNTIGRYGYVKVDVDSSSNTTSYIVIYDNNAATMKIFSGNSYDAVSGTALDEIKFVAGESVTISTYDQTKILNSVLALDENLEMIGYRLSKIHSNDLDNADHTEYVYTYTSSLIEETNKRTGYTYSLNVYFAPIQYNINISLSQEKTGNFDVYNNGVTNVDKNSFAISNLNVYDGNNGGKNYLVTYNSIAGFKLCSNAFVLSLSNECLKSYDDLNPEQDYLFSFNSGWLRDHFYSIGGINYSSNTADLGTININTEAIVFTYKVKLYDTTSKASSAFFADDNVGTFALSAISGKGVLPSISSKFEGLGDTLGYAYIYDTTEYAVLNSRLYFTSEPTTIRNNYYTTYQFLMKTLPTTTYEIDSSIISRMAGASVGIIIPSTNRTIFIMLEVREIFEITMQTEMMLHDNNSTTRTTTITNGNENATTLTNAPASNYLETATAYTYKGLNNTISSTFNAKHYTEVVYLIEGAVLTDNPFTVDEDVNIIIHYVPRALNVAVRYFLDDVEVDLDDIADKITDVTYSSGEFYRGNLITYSNVLTSNEYYYEIFFNDKNAEANTTSTVVASGTKFVSKYTVVLADFEKAFIEIKVKLISKASGSIHVEFMLYDPSQSTAYDTQSRFGSISFTVDGSSVSSSGGTISVMEGKGVVCHVNVSAGYSMYGWKQKGEKNITATTTNSFTISSSFDPDVNSGIYYVYLKKDVVQANIDNNELYTIASEGETPFISTDIVTLSNLYVGKTIDFVFNKPANESYDLKYFYYTDKLNNTNPIISSGSASLTLTITSELLSSMTKSDKVWVIPFGCELTENHKLTYVVNTGAENLDKFEVKYKPIISKILSDGGEVTYVYGEFKSYVSGSYVGATEIQVQIMPKSDPDSNGFYTIVTTGSLLSIPQSSKVKTVDQIFNLTEDETLNVSIIPTEYNASFVETVYTNLEDLSNNTPTLEINVTGVESVDSLLYKQNATIFIKTIIMNGDVKDRELDSIKITNPDGSTLTLTKSEISLGGQFGEDGYIYIMMVEDDLLSIRFLVDADITITLNYVMYKLIHGAES